MGHSFIRPADLTHELLSLTHSDTTPAVVALGALVTGQYILSPTTAGKKCWGDGAPFPGIYTGNANGEVKFWIDGAPGPWIDGGSGSCTWQRLVQGRPGQVLAVGSSGLEWIDVSGVGAGQSGRVYRSTDQSLTSSADNTISWEAAEWDDGTYWSAAAPTKLTITTSGVYVITGAIAFPQGISGLSWTRIYVSGTMRAQEMGGLNNVDPAFAPSNGYDNHQCSATLKLTAGAYVELHAYPVRYSGVSAKAKGGQYDTWLSIVRVG